MTQKPDPAIEELFLEVDRTERRSSVKPLGDMRDFIATLVDHDYEVALRRSFQDAHFYAQIVISEGQAPLVHYVFSLYADLVGLFVDRDVPQLEASTLDTIEQHLVENGCVLIPAAATAFPYTGQMKFYNGVLYTDLYQCDWYWRFFGFEVDLKSKERVD